MRFHLAVVTAAAAAGFVMTTATAPGASAHACSSSFFSKHLSVVQQLLTGTPYGTRTTLQEVFRLPANLRSYRNLTISQAVRMQPSTAGSLRTTAVARTRMIRVFLRSAATGYLNGMAYPAWIGPNPQNLMTNVHHVLMTGDSTIIRSYGNQLAVANNEIPCTLG
jgi:hypothetical protein